MSQNLYWEPAERKMNALPDELKYALRKRHGGSVHETYNDSDVPYLEGLRDAGINGAQDLIDAIQRYDRVTVTER